jgi:hypothetical protein
MTIRTHTNDERKEARKSLPPHSLCEGRTPKKEYARCVNNTNGWAMARERR